VSDQGDRAALDSCGCCEAGVPGSPIHNRPGLPALEYRLGTHPLFLEGMLARLPELLPALGTRAEDDPAVALLDGWAVVADVLTFYQERIANEGFLRTATERRSVLELARAVGYELNPGVAASTHLRFTVDDRPPPPGMATLPAQAVVPRGTRVQSMPAQDELPQSFETSHEITARGEWNELRPRLTRPQPLSLDTRRLYVDGAAAGLSPGDRVLITQPVAGVAAVATAVLEVRAAAVEPELARTRVDLTLVGKPPQAPPPPPPLEIPKLPLANFFLLPTPLTVTHIQAQILATRIPEKRLRAQIKTQGWDVDDFEDFVDYRQADGARRTPRRRRRRRRPDELLEEIFEPFVPPPLPPFVTAHSPADGADQVNVVTNATVAFSEDMDRDTITSKTIQLFPHAAGGPPGSVPVDATVGYDADTRTATLDPVASLAIDTRYTVRVHAGADGPKDKQGRFLAAAVSWSFTTAGDTTTPTIVDASRSPAPNATAVPATSIVSVAFSEPMKAASITTTTMFLTVRASGELVPATVSYDAAATTARLTPSKRLDFQTEYRVTVKGGTPPKGPADGVRDVAGNLMAGDATWNFTTAPRPPVPPEPRELAAFAFGEQSAFFGAGAPRWGSLPAAQVAGGPTQKADPYPDAWEATTRAGATNDRPRTIWTDSQGGSTGYGGDIAYLERPIPALQAASWTLLESATGVNPYFVSEVSETSRADYALTARTTRLTLSQPNGRSPSDPAAPEFMVRDTTAHVVSRELPLAELPVDDPLRKGDRELVLDGLVLGLDEGQPLLLSGERGDLPGVLGHEVVVIAPEIEHVGGFTTLRFADGLKSDYVRRTVTLSANVAPATHGETMPGEVLGGGDGREPNLRFALRKPPLTHVSARNPRGAESSLELRVNGVLWKEAPGLFDLGPRDERYIVRTEEDGRTSVIFGDGRRGARVPTGAENVVATYRSGIGAPGMVGADRLTLMQTRPLGVEAVTNPLPASGAADPETRDSARANAPRSTLALERIVSLADVENFARGFAGIGKAQAAGLWRGATQVVHVTVGAENGDEIRTDSDLFKNLVLAIEDAREPSLRISVGSYARRYFELSAELVLDGRRLPERVIADVQRRLMVEFSFERRSFGQPVTSAEVISLIHGADGVVAVELDVLRPIVGTVLPAGSTASGPPPPFLAARRTRLAADGTIEPSELLLLSPAPADIRERRP
jgi:hypothetical protein